MTDKQMLIEMFEKASIDHEEWNPQLVVVNDGIMEFCFDVDGNLVDIIANPEVPYEWERKIFADVGGRSKNYW